MVCFYYHGCFLFSIQKQKLTEYYDASNRYRQFGSRAVQLNIFAYLHRILSQQMFKVNSAVSRVARKTVYYHLLFWCDLLMVTVLYLHTHTFMSYLVKYYHGQALHQSSAKMKKLGIVHCTIQHWKIFLWNSYRCLWLYMHWPPLENHKVVTNEINLYIFQVTQKNKMDRT